MPSDHDSLAGDLIRAVEILGEVFEALGVRYALLGGLATMLRGRPRFTQDIDILLDVPQIALSGLLDDLVERGFSMDRDTVIRQFVREHMTSFRFGSKKLVVSPYLTIIVLRRGWSTTASRGRRCSPTPERLVAL